MRVFRLWGLTETNTMKFGSFLYFCPLRQKNSLLILDKGMPYETPPLFILIQSKDYLFTKRLWTKPWRV